VAIAGGETKKGVPAALLWEFSFSHCSSSSWASSSREDVWATVMGCRTERRDHRLRLRGCGGTSAKRRGVVEKRPLEEPKRHKNEERGGLALLTSGEGGYACHCLKSTTGVRAEGRVAQSLNSVNHKVVPTNRVLAQYFKLCVRVCTRLHHAAPVPHANRTGEPLFCVIISAAISGLHVIRASRFDICTADR
jgi:hypothetical protein